jgi:hypothetical protein
MSRVGYIILCVAGVFAVTPDVRAQVPADDGERLVTRFYDITPLVVPRQQYPFELGPGNRNLIFSGSGFGGAIGGGGGGMGGGGIGGMSGGGAFSLPLEPLQFGGGGGLPASGGFIGSDETTEPSLKDELENSSGISIRDLFESNISPDSWSTNGGSGSITELGSSLLIRQTANVHQEIELFLKELITAVIGQGNYQLEAWWLPTTEANRADLQQLLALLPDAVQGPEASAAIEQLTTFAQFNGGYHGTLLCRERVMTHMASGDQVPVVVGSIPLVGQGEAGVQPIVQNLHLGLMLEARVLSVPTYLLSDIAPWSEGYVDLNFRSALTNLAEKDAKWPTEGNIDRYSLGKHAAEGACRLPLGIPTVVASLNELSTAGKNPEGQARELLIVVRVSKVRN